MHINDVCNKEELFNILILELKNIGIKYRKEKKCKTVQEKSYRKRIFGTHLHLLESTDVFLANGHCVEIPRFIADACNRILEHVEVEGIFRKAGSSSRQKEIRISLEAGLPLGKTHHVIDVANVIKYFIRELPEPIIPTSIQETLLRSLLIGENHIRAILLTCLLLPPLTINTLSFFMQFLYTVSLSANHNKMTIENLAIIFTPGLMPCANINSHRFANHIKMVQILIENANSIGKIPDFIVEKLQLNEERSTNTPAKHIDVIDVVTEKKKKKRRSDMFNGIKKIVGSALGNSSENLENTAENKMFVSSNALAKNQQVTQQSTIVVTPCIKSTKKRKFTDPVGAFSAKKKRDLLALLPSNSGGFLPNTPLTKQSKKVRSSLGGNRNAIKNISTNPVVTSMERRWSIVGSGWSKPKNKNTETKNRFKSNENIFETEIMIKENSVSPVASITTSVDFATVENVKYMDKSSVNNEGKILCTNESTGVTIISTFKNEYEEIKERVAAIETRISHEFKNLMHDKHSSSSISSPIGKFNRDLSGPERVQNKYEKMIEESEALLSNPTDQLAKRLSRDLKIRRSIDQRIIRSPSARKIGTLRRRSQEKVRLSRNQTWHISSTNENNAHLSQHNSNAALPPTFYSKCVNLKRGRPNTLYTGLSQQLHIPLAEKSFDEAPMVISNEQWTSGEMFFNDRPQNTKLEDPEIDDNPPRLFQKSHIQTDINVTPVKNTSMSHVKNSNDNILTPMLPPKSAPRRLCAIKTPNTTSKSFIASKFMLSTPIQEELNGRESIAKLRALNAGMVLAKAKLFDGLGGGCSTGGEHISTNKTNICRRSSHFTSGNRCEIQSAKVTPKKLEDPKSSSHVSKTHTIETPLTRKGGYLCDNSALMKKQQRLAKYVTGPSNQLLDKIIPNDKLVTHTKKEQIVMNKSRTDKENDRRKMNDSPRITKKVRNHLNMNSPRRMRKNHIVLGNDLRKICSPMKSTTCRNSPRIIKTKQHRKIDV